MPVKVRNLYEEPSLRDLGEGLIRPGGLELTRRALALSALKPGARLLDLGCGAGAALRYLVARRGFRAVGIDPSTTLVSTGRAENPGLPVAVASGTRLPFAPNSMDAVLAECSLSLIANVAEALNECFRVLDSEGMLLAHDIYARNPSGAALLRRLPFNSCLGGAASRQQWIERLKECGFTVISWEDHSRALNEFAARLIFKHGRLETFWARSLDAPSLETASQVHSAVLAAKPGYFLLVARKTDGPCSTRIDK